MMKRLAMATWLGVLAAGCGAPQTSQPWTKTEFAGPSPFHGLHGLAIAPDGQILAGSVVGQTIYSVDPATGVVTERLGPPNGMADDIAFGPDGVMAWTGYLTGKVFVQMPGAEPKMVASGLPGANSLAFTTDGRLYVTQVFLADALHEVDWKGDAGARLIAENLGGLNGFEIGPDGMIYGPLWFKGVIARVDPATGEATPIAQGFQVPAAANFGPDGKLYAIDTKTGELKSVDIATGATSVIATLSPSLDNLAIADSGLIYVSNMAEAAIFEVNPATGAVRTVVSGPLSTPTDMVVVNGPNGESLHVADVFAYRTINTATGDIRDPLRMYRDPVENPLGIGAGPNRVVITSWAAGTVQIVEIASGAASEPIHGLTTPVDGLELTDGRVAVLESSTGLIRILETPQGEPARPADEPLASGLNLPAAMAEGPDGMIYVTETNPGAIARVDPANGEVTRIVSDLLGPEGIDVGPDGRIYFAEVGASAVRVFDPSDKTTTTIGEGLEVGFPAPEGALPAYATTGVALSKTSGSVYVSSDITNSIYRFDPPPGRP